MPFLPNLRPTSTPSSSPTATPPPSATFAPSSAPTATNLPTAPPSSQPTLTALLPHELLQRLILESISIPSALALLGMMMALYFFHRDARREKRWRKMQLLHAKAVDEARQKMNEKDASEEEIDSFIKEHFPAPEEPVYVPILTQAWRLFRCIESFVANNTWLCCCEVALRPDPLSSRRWSLSSPSEQAATSPMKSIPSELLHSLVSNDQGHHLSHMQKETLKEMRRKSIGRWSIGSPRSPGDRSDDPSPCGAHAEESLVDGFPLDAGPGQNYHMLSYTKAIFERLKRVPHKVYERVGGKWDLTFDEPSRLSRFLPESDGRFWSVFSLTENLGQHNVGETWCERWWCRSDTQRQRIDRLMRSTRCALLRCRDTSNPLLHWPLGIRL